MSGVGATRTIDRVKALVALVLLAGLASTACSGGSDEGGADPAPSTPSVPESSASGGGPEIDLAATDVCGLVRDGIDAFNVGDLEGTIERFEEAVPLAEDLAEEQPSEQTETLLDAVRYYADIPAKDYVEESQTSAEFLEFKDFTLTECAYGGPPADATDPAIPA